MKRTFKFQIIIIHLWFLVCSFLMITQSNEIEYIGKTEAPRTDLYELLFYISLFILVVFYISVIGKRYLKKSD